MAEITRLTQADTLLTGIQAKLAEPLTSGDVSKMITQVQAEIAALDRLASDAAAEVSGYAVPTTIAMDPARNGQSLSFAAGRLRELAQVLWARLETEADAEAQVERRAAFQAAIEARDAAVTVLRTEYPNLARRLADLMEQVAEADRVVTAVNARAPRGSESLQRVETAASAKVAALLNLPDLEGRVLIEMDHGEMTRLQSERFHSSQQRTFAAAQPKPDPAVFAEAVARARAANAALSEIDQRKIGGRAA